MKPGISVSEQLDDFNKIILDLANINVKIEDEDQALILLNLILSFYENLQDTMLFGRDSETLTLEDVQVALNSKEMKKDSEDVMVKVWVYEVEIQREIRRKTW